MHYAKVLTALGLLATSALSVPGNSQGKVAWDLIADSGFVEGDIVMDEAQAIENYGQSVASKLKRNNRLVDRIDRGNRDLGATSSNLRLWPDNTIYFQFDSAYPSELKATVRAHLVDFEAKTNIRIIESQGDGTHYVVIINGGGCWSYLGRIGRPQEMSLPQGCTSSGTVKHEFMHALGFHHEQSAQDRDNFVTILWDNIREGYEDNFNKLLSESAIPNKYDYRSVMHYPTWAFRKSSDVVTIDCRGNACGSGSDFTASDIQDINTLYPGLATPSPTNPPTLRPTTSPTNPPTLRPTTSPTTPPPTNSPTTPPPTKSPTTPPPTNSPTTPPPTNPPTLKPTGTPTTTPPTNSPTTTPPTPAPTPAPTRLKGKGKKGRGKGRNKGTLDEEGPSKGKGKKSRTVSSSEIEATAAEASVGTATIVGSVVGAVALLVGIMGITVWRRNSFGREAGDPPVNDREAEVEATAVVPATYVATSSI